MLHREARAIQGSQTPHDCNTSETTKLTASCSAWAPESRQTRHCTSSQWEPASRTDCTTALALAPQVTATAPTHSPVLNNAAEATAPVDCCGLHVLAPSLLPYFDKPDLVLHATALQMWVEQKAATCAASAAAAAWNIVCGHPRPACLPGSHTGTVPATTSSPSESPQPRAIPAPAVPSSSSSVTHDPEACACPLDSNSNHSDTPASPPLLQADDILRVYAVQQQDKVCSQPIPWHLLSCCAPSCQPTPDHGAFRYGRFLARFQTWLLIISCARGNHACPV